MRTMAVVNPIGIALEIARAFGLEVDQPVALRSTNNIVVWLKPSPVVAKISAARLPRLHTELKVAQELCSLGAPSVAPAPEIPPLVHSRQGVEVTFWRYHAQHPEVIIPLQRLATALRSLHLALDKISPQLRATLPSYLQELAFVRQLLADGAALPALTEVDRELLARTFDSLRSRLDVLAPADSHIVLHGAVHQHNVLLVAGEPRFIDFETACTGPVEWDVAHLDPNAEPFYGHPLQARLLWTCRAVASVKTAVWCWADVERGDLREHAEWHLGHVRANIAPLLDLRR